VNILNGVLKAAIPFQPGLNIISGENGTLKTKLLQEIKAGRFRPSDGAQSMPRIQAISPKRNSERRAIDAIFQTMRQQNKSYDTFVRERGGAQINDTTFENYPSLGELFFFALEHRNRDGGSQIDHMNSITKEFNGVIRELFRDYELSSKWNPSTGTPQLKLIKKQVNEVPIEALSTGEQEILSIVTNLYSTHNEYDVYLIDEPEVHLNWHLEDRLFAYLNEFCERYSKQIIVATHSRVIFKQDFLSKTIFFYWDDEGQVRWNSELSSEQRKRIAGEAIEIIRLGDFSHRTFFVEDNEQESVVRILGEKLDAQVAVSVCGNAPNVRSLYRRAKADGGWEKAFFLEDGDNQNSPFPGEDQFIHLSKYSIENFLIDFNIATLITGKCKEELQRIIYNSVIANKYKILGKSKFLEFLIEQLKPEDLTEDLLAKLDASVIFPDYLKSLESSFYDYLDIYISEAMRQNVLSIVFPSILIEAIQNSHENAKPINPQTQHNNGMNHLKVSI
jgi:predicted ATPase